MRKEKMHSIGIGTQKGDGGKCKTIFLCALYKGKEIEVKCKMKNVNGH